MSENKYQKALDVLIKETSRIIEVQEPIKVIKELVDSWFSPTISKADIMFKDIGFVKYVSEYKGCMVLNYIRNRREIIYFDIKNKTVTGEDRYAELNFSIKEIEAVNCKMKELGWYNE